MSTCFLVVCLNPTIQKTFRLPRLEAGQVNRVADHRTDASGKGVNVTRILTQLGERAVHLTQVGGRQRDLFLSLAAEDGLDVQYVDCEIEIRHCYTLLDEAESSTTEIVEPGSRVPADLERRVRARYLELLPDAHTVIISGSKAPGFSDELYPAMVAEARSRGAAVVLDVRGRDLIGSLPHGPSLLKINVNEFSATFLDETLPEETPPEEMPAAIGEQMRTLRRTYGTEVVLTNGARPVMHADDETIELIAPVRVSPVNAIGSGDAVTAGVAAGLRRGMPMRDAIALGLDCARKNVQLEKPGTIE